MNRTVLAQAGVQRARVGRHAGGPEHGVQRILPAVPPPELVGAQVGAVQEAAHDGLACGAVCAKRHLC